MLGAGPAHALAVEVFLRPVLTELGAVVPGLAVPRSSRPTTTRRRTTRGRTAPALVVDSLVRTKAEVAS